MMTGGPPPRSGMADNSVIAQQLAWGNWQPRPMSRGAALEAIDHDLAELEAERETAGLVSSVGEDGEPDFGTVPVRFVPTLMERLHELIEADRRTLEARRAGRRGHRRAGVGREQRGAGGGRHVGRPYGALGGAPEAGAAVTD